MNDNNKQKTNQNPKLHSEKSGGIQWKKVENTLIRGEQTADKLFNLIIKTAVAVFFVSTLIAAILILIYLPSPLSDISDIYDTPNVYDMLGINTSEYEKDILPSDKKIFDPNKSITEQLSQIILYDDVRVYKNDSLRFNMSENKINEEDLPKLSEQIEKAQEMEAGSKTDENETVVYYLVLFDDNRMVNFSLSETTLEVNGKKYTLKQ